jgi:hypothetical protein
MGLALCHHRPKDDISRIEDRIPDIPDSATEPPPSSLSSLYFGQYGAVQGDAGDYVAIMSC